MTPTITRPLPLSVLTADGGATTGSPTGDADALGVVEAAGPTPNGRPAAAPNTT